MIRYLLPAIGFALCAESALAVGLGEAQQQSSLGQPLRIEVPLVDSQEWDIEQFRVKLSGASAPVILRSVKATVTEGANGKVIRMRSETPIAEPYVDLTVTLSWPEGTIQRDYQVLLDPPANQ